MLTGVYLQPLGLQQEQRASASAAGQSSNVLIALTFDRMLAESNPPRSSSCDVKSVRPKLKPLASYHAFFHCQPFR